MVRALPGEVVTTHSVYAGRDPAGARPMVAAVENEVIDGGDTELPRNVDDTFICHRNTTGPAVGYDEV